MSVVRAKSAFMYYQSENLAAIKRELGPGTTMGASMTELSARWKSLPEDGRAHYAQLEADDRARFQRESAEADAIAAAEQEARRQKLIATDGEMTSSRGARQNIQKERDEREQKEERRRRRKREIEEEMDPEELERRRRAKATKKAEKAARAEKRNEEERLLKERHRKLDKAESARSNSRLEYLLQQSSIFAKLKLGGKHKQSEEKKDDGDEYVSHHRQKSPTRGKNKKKKSRSEEVGDTDESDIEQEEHVFLTKQPACIKFGTLKPYQLEGLNWMIHLMEKGLNGILADEMGLGKTLQSISVLAYQFEFLNIQGPHLIVVPKSTLSNWMNELARWCPSLRAIKFHGNKEERQDMVLSYFTNEAAAHDGMRPDRPQTRNPESGDKEDDNSDNPRAWDVCVTTYEVCNSERRVLEKFAWRYLVIDEAHRLKNEASTFSHTVRGFKTAFRLLLTGTPLQNNLHELWALLNFLLPDIFSSSEQFDEWFDLDVDDEEAKKAMIAQLHNILRPFMIRRVKKDVAKGLPPKTETLVMVGMSKMQKQLYKNLLLRDIDSITGKSTEKNRTAILNIVMQLRKCTGHPYLFEGVEDRTLDPLGDHLVENCGKLHMLDKLLKRLKERGSRVLIFTQMTRVLDILEDFMHMREYEYCRIDGNTEYVDRESSIDTFNAPGSTKFCFILSTRAGGLGINLQTADTCILYDSDWNPQADLQAQDRCHRIGQTKPVSIFRLVTENTIEEKIVERAQQKLKLDAMIVQQGRLKDKDKVSTAEVMAAVRFGADTIFRSEESTITDDDIDIILERGKAKTKELASKLQNADKGDLLDFRLDAGISAQTFEGIDYGDTELRKQLRLMAANSMGKRERRAPPANYNPVTQPKKSMVVNNRKIKLPPSLRLPRMEDHQFFNRERLMELGKLEFENYASLREIGKVPPRNFIDNVKSLLPDELGQEKTDLLNEGFANFTRSQYFLFVKSCTKYGRDDIESIVGDMELPLETVTAYSKSFWEYGKTELKESEWERALNSIEKGEQRLAKQKQQKALLKKFIDTFDDPRNDLIFANKGTQHFALEQDRALLCAVNEHGYGNWDAIREEIHHDKGLLFQHTVRGMNNDTIAKRVDYRLRQMEKEFEAREKKLNNAKAANVIAAEKALRAITEAEQWEANARILQLEGSSRPPLSLLSDDGKMTVEVRNEELQGFAERLREIEMQVRNAKKLAVETRKSIKNGAQYVNYSNINLKADGQLSAKVEEEINSGILRVAECGVCKHCMDDKVTKLCVKRREVRDRLLAEAEKKYAHTANKAASLSNDTENKSKPGPKKKDKDSSSLLPGDFKSPGGNASSAKKKKKSLPGIGKGHGNGGSRLGSKRMAVPEELIPEICKRVGGCGTDKRNKLIEDFVRDYPDTSNRQVTFKFSELTTKDRPPCVPVPKRREGPGRAVYFFLRPRFYRHLLPEDRPKDWETFAKEDEKLFEAERKEGKEESETAKKPDGDSASGVDGGDAASVGTNMTDRSTPPPKKRQKTQVLSS